MVPVGRSLDVALAVGSFRGAPSGLRCFRISLLQTVPLSVRP